MKSRKPNDTKQTSIYLNQLLLGVGKLKENTIPVIKKAAMLFNQYAHDLYLKHMEQKQAQRQEATKATESKPKTPHQ